MGAARDVVLAPLAFSQPLKTLFFVPAFFKANKNDQTVSWLRGVSSGVRIRAGSDLAVIFWDDGTEETIRSPVAGVISRTNRNILHATLHKDPAQFALIFV